MDPRRIEDAYTDYEAKQRSQILEDEEIQKQYTSFQNKIARWLESRKQLHTARVPHICADCKGIIEKGTQYTKYGGYLVNDFGQIYPIHQYRHYPICSPEGTP
ncbi:hypothetical protein [Candidatus Bathycorpusculum sp.]|uniref:hypothetical protein n=1 Tax=Candidatus Bathycorpusculum sp. TaxID=2994959 RepID=UPI0028275923|nr:hypothetical protein [Candidatus Termitimicrobium sp.]